jgi:hypothetical protein
MQIQGLAILAAAVLALGGCVRAERAPPSEPIGGYAFRYVAPAHGEAIFDAAAEQQRLADLDRYVHDRNLCPAGYTVVTRSPDFAFAREDAPEDWMRYVLYLGICKA